MLKKENLDGRGFMWSRKRNTHPKEKIGILYMCTGQYVLFWDAFYKTMEKKFCLDCGLEYFVFTDADHIEEEELPNVHRIYRPCQGWPNDTLLRYDIFLESEELYSDCDYLFFFNANYICCKRVKEKDFLPLEEGLLFTQHPGQSGKPVADYTYERNPQSEAFIPMGEGVYYVAGGLNGGKTSDYLCLVRELSERIHRDLDKGVIAIYHDESHINRYLYDMMQQNRKFKLLSPAYCYPEDWRLPYTRIMMLREKDKYFDVSKIKG